MHWSRDAAEVAKVILKQAAKRVAKTFLDASLARWGYQVVRGEDHRRAWNPDDDEVKVFQPIFELCRPYTMTTKERMYALFSAATYVSRCRVPGDVVECGVWRGGSSMVAAETLARAHDTARAMFLFDTFQGMSEPTAKDVDYLGRTARENLGKNETFGEMCYASLEDVTANMYRTGYPRERINFIRGKVEETVPANAPERIAVLRLDTDWYESTYHELVHLYPRLSPGGVLIIDDYGYWKGARQAVQQYFAETGEPMLLNRIDYTGRIGVKLSGGSS